MSYPNKSHMDLPELKDIYTENDLDSLGFHDCYVRGIRWRRSTFSFSFDLEYIVKWMEPDATSEHYRFWICLAELCFENVSDAEMELDWKGLALGLQLESINRQESRTTPNGNVQWYWELELLIPQGSIALWATGFKLKFTGPPILSLTQYLEE